MRTYACTYVRSYVPFGTYYHVMSQLDDWHTCTYHGISKTTRIQAHVRGRPFVRTRVRWYPWYTLPLVPWYSSTMARRRLPDPGAPAQGVDAGPGSYPSLPRFPRQWWEETVGVCCPASAPSLNWLPCTPKHT
jgi:hypothetical protein